ncbi:MAG: 50S ribosomal protein L10, partial [Bacteroidales bacterium]|nr:50S ribosomal protein L10 [Bacteroidales bacterium]
MRREEKEVIIDNLAQRLDETKHFYLTDISSLNAEQTSNLR